MVGRILITGLAEGFGIVLFGPGHRRIRSPAFEVDGQPVFALFGDPETLDSRDLHDGVGAQEDDRQGVLRHLIGSFLLDAGATGVCIRCFDLEDGEASVAADLTGISAGEGLLAGSVGLLQVEGAVSFQDIHVVEGPAAIGTDLPVSHALPSVVHGVFERFFLSENSGGQGDGAEECEQPSLHIYAFI